MEDGDGELVVLDMHREHRVAFGSGHECVGEVDVRFGDHQRVEALQQAGAGFAHGDHDQFAAGVRDAFLDENLLGRVGIRNHKAGDGGIARVLDAEADDFDGRGAEQFHQGRECAGAVGQHDRELSYGCAVIDEGFRFHDGQDASSAMGISFQNRFQCPIHRGA